LMENLRKYGNSPFSLAVIHGGPGAPGSMAPVARELAVHWGVLEPLQTANSVDGQVQELRTVLTENADLPVTLIGSSWGAMLGFIFTAHHPELVKKLILVGSGVYEARYVAQILETRLNRLSEEEKIEIRLLTEAIYNAPVIDKDRLMARIGKLFTKADACHPFTLKTEVTGVNYDLYARVWKEAQELRASGQLLALGKRISCPVVAIHGDYDPHPAEGVREPLSAVLKDFRFILLKNCGHLPWIEKEAKDNFYKILREELSQVKERSTGK
jgi:pimeloyl-ACP methyl ester carboxylesterase